MLWVVRSITTADLGVDTADPTREVTVSLIGDSSGEVIDSQPLTVAIDYDPARLWVTVSHGKLDPNGDQEVVAFYQAAFGGHPNQGGPIGIEPAGAGGVRKYGPDLPLILDAGTYTVDAWLDAPVPFPMSQPWGDGCSTTHKFDEGDDVMLNASFNPNWSCHWSDGATPAFPPY